MKAYFIDPGVAGGGLIFETVVTYTQLPSFLGDDFDYITIDFRDTLWFRTDRTAGPHFFYGDKQIFGPAVVFDIRRAPKQALSDLSQRVSWSNEPAR